MTGKANDFAEWLKKVQACGPPPIPTTSVLVDEESSAIEVMLDPTVPNYSEWIPGEGGDMCLLRDQSAPNRVVGVRLPLKFKDVIFSCYRE